jgi:hypothetical protein
MMQARRLTDAALSCCLLLGTIAYLHFWPRDFYIADEGQFLYEAKAILDGMVLYRDVFEVVSPLAWYWLAAVFHFFGVHIDVARTAMAVVHGTIAASLFLICRNLGIHRSLGVAAGVGQTALCYPAFSNVTPHWLSTLVALWLFLCFIRRPWIKRPRWAIVPGLLAGLAIGLQQQRGIPLFAGGAAILCADRLLERYYRIGEPRLPLTLVYYACGTLLVCLPLAAWITFRAGFAPAFFALVQFPIARYYEAPSNANVPWGLYTPVPDFYVHPLFIKYLPTVLPVALALVIPSLHRRTRYAFARLDLLQVAFCVIAVVTIIYNKNYTHIALIAPFYLVMIAFVLHTVLISAPEPCARVGTVCLGIFLAVGLPWELLHNLETRQRLFPHSAETDLGRIDVLNPAEATVARKMRQLLDASESREFFCLPLCAGLYLMTNGENPTPYQTMLPDYNSPEQHDEVIRILRTRPVRYVLVQPHWVGWKNNPIVGHLKDNYVRVPMPLGGRIPPFILFSLPEVAAP